MKHAFLKPSVWGGEFIAHNTPYEFKEVDKNPSMIHIDGKCYDRMHFQFTETKEIMKKPKILKGKVETVEECIVRLREVPFKDIAEEIVNLRADFHNATGESTQLGHNMKMLQAEIEKTLKTYGVK